MTWAEALIFLCQTYDVTERTANAALRWAINHDQLTPTFDDNSLDFILTRGPKCHKLLEDVQA